jgi:cytochrome c peroxidase
VLRHHVRLAARRQDHPRLQVQVHPRRRDAVLEDRAAAQGYVAPPLDGVWATAPYFHNGSVPTLWHVLHPAERPVAWRRSPTGYDAARMGLEVEARDAPPDGTLAPAERRTWFDTRKPGKSAAGHDFPDALSEPAKAAVLEYLKTL